MTTLQYPLPRPDPQTRPYWDGAAAGELRYQRCAGCQKVQLIPRSLCEHCQCPDLHWEVSNRRGRVKTFTIVHRAPLPVFKDQVPYAIVIIDMDEGFRVMANVLPEVQKILSVGARVSMGFQMVHGMALPVVETVERVLA